MPVISKPFLVLFILAFMICHLAISQVRFPVGMSAELNVVLTDLQNKKNNLQQSKGKVIIIHQWATWCSPCKKEEPLLQHFYNEYQNEIALFMISEENTKRLKKYKEKHHISLPYYTVGGKNQHLPKMYFSETIPVSYIISKKGEVRMIATGALDWQSEAVQKFIEKLIDE
ncbi:MAG: TlpA family protein disulfide reductase [Flavobacteriales bacterium]|nr:TlpA family protein disulfide reductase [Flavobacteriales bacterium]